MAEAKQPGQHVKRRQAINTLERETIEELIDRCALREEDAAILRHKHINHHDENYIADTLGWAVITVRKHYSTVLHKLYDIAKRHGYINE